ncbi:MAG: CtsR family transcriptional regulator [Clostridiales bacterium]|nr:CtsR family transcriptional regulator [Clostridiales bacterium]
MSNISDIIEEFILEQLEDCDNINLSRNELANFFSCAPSQINYVLSTRFTAPKGYIVESHRGGGGYIRLIRVNYEKNDYIRELISSTLQDDIDYSTALKIIENLYELDILDDSAKFTLEIALSPKALSMPLRIENKQRANILKTVLINYIKGK